MDIKIEEQNNLYCVCVKIPKYNPREKRKIVLGTAKVRQEVEKLGYQLGEVVQEDRLHNLNGLTQGVWFFKKKTVDKPVEDVILVQEKAPVAPKPAKRTSTRSKRTVKKTTPEG